MRESSKLPLALSVLCLSLFSCGHSSSPAAAVAGQNASPTTPPVPRSPVRIATINGINVLGRGVEVGVHPGDVVQLVADSFVRGRPLHRSAALFSWRADAGPRCDAAREASCLNSGFLLDETGVTFVVPDDMGTSIMISATLTLNPARADSIVLHNLGDNLEREDPVFRRFPRWNPQWNGQRRTRWEKTWNRRWDRG